MSRREDDGDERQPEPPLGEVMEFLRLIWQLDHRLQTTSKRMERTLGLSGPQRFVLRLVGKFPNIPAGKLARIMHVHPGTLSALIRRMEERGLIERRADPADRRRVLIGLTERGRKLDVDTPGTVEAAVSDALASLSPRGVEASKRALVAIAGALARLEEEPVPPAR